MDFRIKPTERGFVVPREGETVDPERLVSFCDKRLPPYMLPKKVEVLDALPKTPSGKVDCPA